MKFAWFRRSAPLVVAAAGLAFALDGCGADSGAANASNCTPAHKFSTVQQGSLTVATYDFPPYVKLDGDKLSGVEGDLLNDVAKRECLTLSVQSAGGAAAAVPSVQSSRADLAAGDWWRTKARAKIVVLSDPIYLDQGAIVSTKGYKTIGDLAGKKIGSVAGNLWNDQFAKLYGSSFTVYQDSEAVYSDLAAGRIDAIIDSDGAAVARFQTAPIQGAQIVPMPADPQIPVSAHPGQVNWPTSQSNPDLTKALNEDIAAMHKDGTIANTLKKYGVNASAAIVGQPDQL